MKTIKVYEEFNALNEGKTQKIDFQDFIDYPVMKLKDFKDSIGSRVDDEEITKEEMDNILKSLKDIWAVSKIELTIDGENLFPSYNAIKKPKYPNLYMFSWDIGAPQLVIISSEIQDLMKRIEKPEGM